MKWPLDREKEADVSSKYWIYRTSIIRSQLHWFNTEQSQTRFIHTIVLQAKWYYCNLRLQFTKRKVKHSETGLLSVHKYIKIPFTTGTFIFIYLFICLFSISHSILPGVSTKCYANAKTHNWIYHIHTTLSQWTLLAYECAVK